MEDKEYKVVSANGQTGISKKTGKPYTKVLLTLERSGQTLDVFSFDAGLINSVGQTVFGNITPSEFRGITEYQFKKAGSYTGGGYTQKQPAYGTDATLLSKLNEILGILHAHFPTAIDLQEKTENKADEELIEEEIAF